MVKMVKKKSFGLRETGAGLNLRPLVMFIIFLIVIPVLAATADLTPEEIAVRLEKKLKSVSALRADFKQSYYSVETQEPVTGQGHVLIQRPDKMRWEYDSPEKQIFLHKDNHFWLYFPEDKQLVKNAAGSEVQESEILGLLSGNFSLLERYQISFNQFPSDRKNVYQIRLLPLNPGQFSYILLEIDRKSWLILKAVFFEPAGGKLEYHFDRIRIGQKISARLFELKIPPDCEIIETGEIKQEI